MFKIEEYHNYVVDCVRGAPDRGARHHTILILENLLQDFKNKNKYLEYYDQIRTLAVVSVDSGGWHRIEDIALSPKEYFRVKQRKDKLNKLL